MEQSLLPNSSSIQAIDSAIAPSKTWRIDFESKKVVGMIDDRFSIEQSIYLALKTGRYERLIFTWNYGEELKKLIGQSKEIAKAEIPRLTRECLLNDDRIQSLENFEFLDIDEGLEVFFDAVTVQGVIPIRSEVQL